MVRVKEAKYLDGILKFLSAPINTKLTLKDISDSSVAEDKGFKHDIVVHDPERPRSSFKFDYATTVEVYQKFHDKLSHEKINLLLDVLFIDGHIESDAPGKFSPNYFCITKKGYTFLLYDGGYKQKKKERYSELWKQRGLTTFNIMVPTFGLVAALGSAYYAKKALEVNDSTIETLKGQTITQQQQIDSLQNYVLDLQKTNSETDSIKDHK